MNPRAVGIVLFAILITVGGARAKEGIGIGIIVGEPTGISIKKWTDREHAIDIAAAWSFSGRESLQLHADYLIHNFGVLKTDAAVGSLPVYYGIGGRVKFSDWDNQNGLNDNDALIGLRIPFGISYIFARSPVDLFAEIVPVLDIVPDTDFDINGAVGVRVYLQ